MSSPNRTGRDTAPTPRPISESGPKKPGDDPNPPRNKEVSSKENERNLTARRNKFKERRIKQLIPLQELFADEIKYPPFYIIQFPGMELDRNVNVISVDDDIKERLGKPKKITKYNRDSLLIEVNSNEQGNNLLKITQIAGNPVTTRLHPTLNEIKGTVLSDIMSTCTNEQLLRNLKSQGVTKIERMKTRRNGELVDTNRYILTFNRTKLPHLIQITDWCRELIELYIPTPLRCTKCQRYGHAKKWCRREYEVCANCGASNHHRQNCPNPPKCCNCFGPHSATDRSCETFIYRSEVIATMTKDRIPHHEAADKVREYYRETGKSYRWVTTPSTANTSSTTNTPLTTTSAPLTTTNTPLTTTNTPLTTTNTPLTTTN